MLESYITNWLRYITICDSFPPGINPSIVHYVDDRQLKEAAEDLLTLLRPIAIAMNRMQSKNAKIADGVHIWKELRARIEDVLCIFPQPTRQYIVNCLIARYGDAVSDFHLVAYELSPTNVHLRRHELSDEEKVRVANFIHCYFPPDFPVRFLKIKEQIHSIAAEDSLETYRSDAEWLRFLHKLDEDLFSREEFEKMMQLATGALSVNRLDYCWSNFEKVYEGREDRVDAEKASKLIKIYHNLNCGKIM